jgi:hypothetical protein
MCLGYGLYLVPNKLDLVTNGIVLSLKEAVDYIENHYYRGEGCDPGALLEIETGLKEMWPGEIQSGEPEEVDE